jgi:hypothetical protein
MVPVAVPNWIDEPAETAVSFTLNVSLASTAVSDFTEMLMTPEAELAGIVIDPLFPV